LGFFITFEGIEGSGKSTQASLLAAFLEEKGTPVLAVREPGGTAIGEKIRAILLNDEGAGMDPWTELLLYEACRAELVSKVIRPALDSGKVVICDRYTDSTLAYQGYGRGLDKGAVRELNKAASGGLTPDVTILVDCGVEEGLRRAMERIEAKGAAAVSMNKEDRFEKESVEFHRRVRDGFLEIAALQPDRVHMVKGVGEKTVIHQEICDIIKDGLPSI
jgi:dTMP kinase